MAITKVSNGVEHDGWAVNGYSADLSGCEELVAAPGAGVTLVLESVAISCIAAIEITIGAGETGGAVTAVVLGPIFFAAVANGNSQFVHRFARPVRLPANTALVVDASAAGATTVYVEGYTE